MPSLLQACFFYQHAIKFHAALVRFKQHQNWNDRYCIYETLHAKWHENDSPYETPNMDDLKYLSVTDIEDHPIGHFSALLFPYWRETDYCFALSSIGFSNRFVTSSQFNQTSQSNTEGRWAPVWNGYSEVFHKITEMSSIFGLCNC